MDESQRARHARIVQVKVVPGHLVGEEQALSTRWYCLKAGNVKVLPFFDGGFPHGFLDTFTDDVELAFKLSLVQMIAHDEYLANHGFGLPGLGADRIAVDGYASPAEAADPFFGNDLLEEALA